MASKYTPNHKGVAEFLVSHELSRATKGIAEQIATVARSTAPRSNNPEDGHYANGIEVHGNRLGGVKGDRIEYEVVATEGHPTLVEWGRSPGNGHPGYAGRHVLGNAAEAVTNG